VTRSFALLCALTAPAGADVCKPHAQLEGDPAAVASVTAELTKLGVVVDATAPAGCKTVFAAVELAREGGLAIAVKTGTQSEGRTVSDAVVAASWIDSWVADDFSPPQPGANGFFDLRPTSPPATVQPRADLDDTVAPASTEHVFGLSASAALDQAWSFDGTRWTGISGGLCVQRDAWCFGARARYATQDILVGQTAATRRDFAALATASYSKDLGRTVVVPELGLGLGKLTTDRVNGCRHVTCDPAHDPSCMEPPPDTECIEHDPAHAYALDLMSPFHVTSITPRAAASLRIAVALADHVFLDGIAAITLEPFGHGDYDLPLGVAPPPGIPREQLALPGQSIGTFEVGLGLRWGYR